MKEITKILKNKKLNEEERKTLTLILRQTEKINKYLGEEGTKEYEEIIMKGEDVDMKNFNEFMNKICNENYQKGDEHGFRRGVRQGVRQGVEQVVERMLKVNER